MSDGSDVVSCAPGVGWISLETNITVPLSAPVAREVTVEVVMVLRGAAGATTPPPLSSVVFIDDVTLEAVTQTGTGTQAGTETGMSSCGGEVGGTRRQRRQQQCHRHPVNILYRLREEGGVAVAYQQVHAINRLAAQALRCRRPEANLVPADCPLLSAAHLPHITSADVDEVLASYTDEELAAHMVGW